MSFARENELAEIEAASCEYIHDLAARFYVIDQLETLSSFYNVPAPSYSYKTYNLRGRKVHGSYSHVDNSINIPVFTTAIDTILAHEFAHHLANQGFVSMDDSHKHTDVFYELVKRVKDDMNSNGFIWDNSPRQIQFGLLES